MSKVNTVTNYAIIDHVGSLTSAENKKIYAKAYALAKAAGVDTIFTLSKVCKMESPFAHEVTNKMKFRQRYTKHPRIVYIICNSEEEANVKFVRQCWENRNIEIVMLEVHPIEENKCFDYGQEESENRRIAEVWAEALGYTFSAPLHRDLNVNDIDMYQTRPDEVEMRRENPNHMTKITKDPVKFWASHNAIAPESEINEFIAFYNALNENNLVHEMLDPDWEICPHCGRPIRVRQEAEAQCRFCDTIINSDVVFERYFDEDLQEDEEF